MSRTERRSEAVGSCPNPLRPSDLPRAETMPFADISHRVEFSAAHRLESPSLTEDENRALYGPCFGDHGHNYALEATVRGPITEETGMVMNLADLAVILQEEVFVPMDHKHLNHDVALLRDVIPTAENVAVTCFRRIDERLQELARTQAMDGVSLHRVRLFESRNNFVEVFGAEENA